MGSWRTCARRISRVKPLSRAGNPSGMLMGRWYVEDMAAASVLLCCARLARVAAGTRRVPLRCTRPRPGPPGRLLLRRESYRALWVKGTAGIKMLGTVRSVAQVLPRAQAKKPYTAAARM